MFKHWTSVQLDPVAGSNGIYRRLNIAVHAPKGNLFRAALT